MKKFDLHVHTKFSFDNNSEPEENIKTAIKKGLDGIAFTDHDCFMTKDYLTNLRLKYKNYLTILRGIEISTYQSHTLVYGLTADDILYITSADTNAVVSVADCVKVANYLKGLAVPAHPFRWGIGTELRSCNIECLEGINGANSLTENNLAQKLAKELKIPFIGGSDAHNPNYVGMIYTEFIDDIDITDENIVEVLKAGKYTVKISPEYSY
jgi:predicted metal-dependent phosphoesterase TrpH